MRLLVGGLYLQHSMIMYGCMPTCSDCVLRASPEADLNARLQVARKCNDAYCHLLEKPAGLATRAAARPCKRETCKRSLECLAAARSKGWKWALTEFVYKP